MLTRYIYLSHAVRPLDREALRQLVDQATAANAQHNVTGLLVYSDGHFMQVVEGPPEEIRQLRTNIEADPRHAHITELRFAPAQQRLFERWALACNLPGAYEGLSLQIARHLAQHHWSDDDIEVLAMLGRFWSDFGGHVEFVEGQQPAWSASVLSS